MQSTFLDHILSVYQNPITCLGDELSNFIEQAPFSAHLRDTKTNRYILSNQFSANNIGLDTSRDLIGLKPRDVIEHRLQSEQGLDYNLAWKEKLRILLDKTYELSSQVLIEKVPAIQRDIELSLSGFIRVTQTIRSPVFDSQKRVVAIASLDCDFVQQCELFYLFQLYTRYLLPKKAIRNFLTYLEVESYFSKMPTCRELTAMLFMRQNSSSKYVAGRLNVSSRTIDEYKARLGAKLVDTSLASLLINLRARNESNNFWD